jgi:hypothetical protein
MSMEGIGQPTASFGIFDHLDHAGGSLRQQYSDRLKIAEACDAAGFLRRSTSAHLLPRYRCNDFLPDAKSIRSKLEAGIFIAHMRAPPSVSSGREVLIVSARLGWSLPSRKKDGSCA